MPMRDKYSTYKTIFISCKIKTVCYNGLNNCSFCSYFRIGNRRYHHLYVEKYITECIIS